MSDQTKSDYEQARERNISRNLEFLKDIGLLDGAKSPLQTARQNKTPTVKKKRSWQRSGDVIEPTRKSSRLSGVVIEVPGTSTPYDDRVNADPRNAMRSYSYV